jgi:hypothetical protein
MNHFRSQADLFICRQIGQCYAARHTFGGIVMRILAGIALLFASAALSVPVWAHPGGLNAQGCHNNRKTGDYHCHRSGSAHAAPSRAVGLASSGGAYRNCSEARAAGAAPVRRGDPGYGPHLDRDNDGIGCE